MSVYITAYGLAVQQGFHGSLDAWLDSLRGPKGDDGKTAYELAVEGGYEGTEEAFKQYVLHGIESDATLSIAGGFADAKAAGDAINSVRSSLAYAQEAIDRVLEAIGAAQEAAEGAQETADSALPKTGGVMEGNIDMDGKSLTGLADPQNETDAVSLGFLNSRETSITATLHVNYWVGDQAPFTQVIPVAGVSEEGSIHVYPVYPEELEDALDLMQACACITHAKRGTDSIIFTCCEEKPAVSIPIEIEVSL